MDNEIMTQNFFDGLKNILSEQNQTVLGEIGKFSKRLDNYDNDLKQVKDDVKYLKEDVAVSRGEVANIRRQAGIRVCELLDVPYNKKERNEDEKIKYKKYSTRLFRKLYTEVAYEGHLAKSSIIDTPKCMYNFAIKDIEAYVPKDGMRNFYNEVDEDAKIKLKVVAMGY